MPKTKNKPGIHLYYEYYWRPSNPVGEKRWRWEIVSKNGRVVACSNPKTPYATKRAAVKSIAIASLIFNTHPGHQLYYDHSKPDSPLQSYL